MKKWENMKSKVYPYIFFVCVLILWQTASVMEVVPSFMLPSPVKVVMTLIEDGELMASNTLLTLQEAFIGMGAALIMSFIMAVLMDRFKTVHYILYPVCIVSQTVPTVAIAPLLVLWFGFGMTPKIILVFITCFFPLLVALVTGFETADKNVLRLYRSMNAGYLKILFDVKLPYALDSFFSGLKISASYCIVGAVIAEWLGGEGGLGVYMTRVRKGFRFDKMFAVIIVISVLSLLLMKSVELLQKKAMPWKKYEKS